jgi:hypothetical protein
VVAIAPAAAPLWAIGAAGEVGAPPAGEAVHVAIHYKASLDRVGPALDALRARGATPVFLVATRNHLLHAIDIAFVDARDHAAIQVVVTPDGKACVSLPGVAEAKCVKTPMGHVDRAYTRELVREAFRASGLQRTHVQLVGDLPWGDVVRAVDGARTCCLGEPMAVTVSK